MTAPRAGSIEELFGECIECQPGELPSRLGAIGDPGLRRAVEDLLRAHEERGGVLDRPEDVARRLRGMAASDADDREDLSGLVAGRYRFERRLSGGGMGSVHLATAHHAGGVERSVAIKVLQARFVDSEQFLERFRHEQRVLASLHHDHIVAFLDADRLPDGRPFLVMEHVEGEPIVAACAALDPGARVRLFAAVLSAVDHAHARGVVHADLKPDNVLVTAQGNVRLVDFGLATLVDGEGSGEACLAWTPSHASPEQIAGEPATTRSDVFSLGRLLYDCASAGGLQVGAELTAIAACATRAEPARRYASVAEFAADLRRFEAGRPVTAMGDRWGYRIRCLARRHPLRLALLLLIALGLGTGVLGLELGRRAARDEASRGWGAHTQAKAAGGVLEDWLLSMAARDPAGAEAAARSIEARIEAGEFAARPETEGLVRLALARFFVEVAERPELARVHLERVRRLASAGGVGPAELRRVEALGGR